MKEEKEIGLLETKENQDHYFKTHLVFGIKGQNALSVSQCFTFEKMYKYWDKWNVRLGVWLINRTKFK